MAFVGRSGSGKTTLIDVILGLLEPTRGCVRVDGADIRGRETEWWPRIGYVPQEIYLFDDTIRRNIALGIPDERIDEERLREAVAMAQLDDVVAESPQGLDTVVGERGARLSGGQRQRIGIARALYGRPGVLVLDEATSALDVETEARISDAIRALAGRMTVIIVAHRLSTVRHCDRLYFMEHGRIVAEGAYDDLLRDCAAFREMAAMAGPEGRDGIARRPIRERDVMNTFSLANESAPQASRPFLVVGGGGHAVVIVDTLLALGAIVEGMLDADSARHGATVLGVPVIGSDEILDTRDPAHVALANAIGSNRNTDPRRAVFERFSARGFAFPSLVHPAAVVAPYVTLGAGVQIMPGAVIRPRRADRRQRADQHVGLYRP